MNTKFTKTEMNNYVTIRWGRISTREIKSRNQNERLLDLTYKKHSPKKCHLVKNIIHQVKRQTDGKASI